MKPLTPHQRQVMQYVVEGHTNEQIGELLHIKAQTVKNILTATYKSLGASNRAHAAALFTRYGGRHIERARDV